MHHLCEARNGFLSEVWVHEVQENEADVKATKQENNFPYTWRAASQPHFILAILLKTDSGSNTFAIIEES